MPANKRNFESLAMTKLPVPIAYVCFRTADPPIADLCHVVRRELGLPHDLAEPVPQSQTFRTERGLIALLYEPFPYPSEDLVDDFAQRIAWPDWQTAIGSWKSHAIVTSLGAAADDFETCKNDTATVLRVASIIARHEAASAVGWSGNVLFHAAADFAQMTAALRFPPRLSSARFGAYRSSTRPPGRR